jgi:thiol-disulfide isomerase/thioredoxin
VLGGAGLGAAVVFVGLQGLVLRAWCPYCLVADTAALIVGLRVLWPAAIRPGADRVAGTTSRALSRGIVGAALAVVVLMLGYAVNPMAAANPTITTDGSAAASQGSGFGQDQLAALADHLRESGAVFYGAYWCPHCQAQKQMFGKAASTLPYVECDPRGTNPQPDACQAAGVRAYPTWVIGGQKLEGEVSPTELARLSGFGG